MLTHLTIRNLALIDSLELEPHAGFTVLTGETGAGKSMVLDALDLALGGRAEAGLLRAGEATCEVTATFTTPKVLQNLLDEQGLEHDDTLTLRRQLKIDAGKDGINKLASRAWLNGNPMPAGVLAQAAEALVDIHSQHGTMALTTPAAQRAVLDRFLPDATVVHAVTTTHAVWQQAQMAADAARAALAKTMADADLRRAWLAELTSLSYQEGEEADLLARRTRVANAAQTLQHTAAAEQALNDDQGALSTLGVAARSLATAATWDDTLIPLAERITAALEDLHDAAHELSRRNFADVDDNLETLDDRLHALKSVARKHGGEVAELPAIHARLQAEEDGATTAGDHVAELEAAAHQAHTTFANACAALSQARTAALPKVHNQLHQALAALLMPHARVAVTLTPLPPENWHAHGAETITFMLAANPGQPAQPLAKVASGGELSRLMLALKTVFYAHLPPQTVILDEIDTGLSGAAAHAVGAAMARLAATHQVIAITHHAQVAAQAQHHWQVSKHTENTHTTTHVQVLTVAARTDEIARLLSGATITDTARAAAKELLAA